MEHLLKIDSQITHSINSAIIHTGFFDAIFSFFSLRGASFFVWVAIILFVIFLEERAHPGIQKRDIKFVVIFLLSFTTTYFLSDIIIKNILQRPRPTGYSICPNDFSFPSTHAATAFAAATVLTAFDKKRKWFYFLVAGLIGISRIYLRCHYFFDVTGGAILGYLLGKIFFNCSKNFFHRDRGF